MLGEHSLEIHLHSDVNVTLSIMVIGEEGSEEEIALLNTVNEPESGSDNSPVEESSVEETPDD
jgi:hypothetical protein